MADEKTDETFAELKDRNTIERPYLLGKTDIDPNTGQSKSVVRAQMEKVKADFADAEAARLMKYVNRSGTVVPESIPDALSGDTQAPAGTNEDYIASLEKMTKAELIDTATGLEIENVPDSATKAEIIELIRHALGI